MKVELISKTVGVGAYKDMTQGEILEAVARHGKIKEWGKLTKYLLREGHYSPLEHMHFGFRIETSRAISAQFARHKSIHFQEFSQRYDQIKAVEEIEIRKAHEKNRQSSSEVFDPYLTGWGWTGSASGMIQEVINLSLDVYTALLRAGVAKECARMILPMASTTTIHMTANLRDWLAFLNQRCHVDTQKEAREIALEIGRILEKEAPEIMNFLNWEEGKFM